MGGASIGGCSTRADVEASLGSLLAGDGDGGGEGEEQGRGEGGGEACEGV